jgi:hypothetical protein
VGTMVGLLCRDNYNLVKFTQKVDYH